MAGPSSFRMKSAKYAPDEMIAFVEGRLTVRAKRKPYFLLPEFRGKYRDNPYVGKRSGGLLSWLFK